MTKQHVRIRRLHAGPLDLAIVPPPRLERLLSSARVRKAIERVPGTGRRHADVARTRHRSIDRASLDTEGQALYDRAREHRWYHTMELGHGVTTEGFVDHRLQLPYYGLPSSLGGKRCLDIATFDGYWAFEFERRGADEVVALDIPDRTHLDCPRWMLRDPDAFRVTGSLGDGFRLAHDLLDSHVKRVEKSVYDLDPDVDGMFDLVFISDVLIHLRDPQLALERAYSVCRGQLVVADVYAPMLDGLGDVPVAQFLGPGETWWYPNVACLRQMMTVAGFEPVEEVSRFTLEAVGENDIHKVVLRGTAAETPSWTVEERKTRARWER